MNFPPPPRPLFIDEDRSSMQRSVVEGGSHSIDGYIPPCSSFVSQSQRNQSASLHSHRWPGIFKAAYCCHRAYYNPLRNAQGCRMYFACLHHRPIFGENINISTLPVLSCACSASDLQTRKKYVSLVETARDRGAKVFVFSRSVCQTLPSKIENKVDGRLFLPVTSSWEEGLQRKDALGACVRSYGAVHLY